MTYRKASLKKYKIVIRADMKMGSAGIVIEEDSSSSSSDEKSKGEKSSNSKSVQKKFSRTTSQVIFVINTHNSRLVCNKTKVFKNK